MQVSDQWQLRTVWCSVEIERCFDVLRWDDILGGLEQRGASKHFLWITKSELQNTRIQFQVAQAKSSFCDMSIGTKQGYCKFLAVSLRFWTLQLLR